MALDQTARANKAGDTAQAEYDAIYDTMMASARGRWFLNEYARRNRTADTNAVLAAIDRIGAHLRGEALPPNAPEYLHLGLMAMAGLVAAVETDMSALSTGHETEESAKPRVKRVVATLRDMGDCVQVMLDNFKPPVAEEQAPVAPPRPPAALTVVDAAVAQSVQAVGAPAAAAATVVAAQAVSQAVMPPAVDLPVAEEASVQAAPQQTVVQQAVAQQTPSAAPVAEARAAEREAESEAEESFTVEALVQEPVAELNPQAAYAVVPPRETTLDAATLAITTAEPVATTVVAETPAPVAASEPATPVEAAAAETQTQSPVAVSETAAAFAVASAELVFETAPPDIEIFEWPPRKPSASADIATIETLSIEPDAAISRPTVATLPLVEPLAAAEAETAVAETAAHLEMAQPALAQTQIAQAEIFPAASAETSADTVEAVSAAAITEAAPARVTAEQLAEILAQAAAESSAAETSAFAGETGEAGGIVKPASTPATTALPLEDFGPSNRVVLNYETDFEPIDLGVPVEMTAAAHAKPAAGSVTAAALPLQDLLPEDHPLAELRTLSKAELTALFS